MLNHDVESRAILVHQNKSTRAIEVTAHPIIRLPKKRDANPESMFTLGAGRVFGHEEKRELEAILGGEKQANDLALMDEHLLAQTPYAVVWWMPSTKRRIPIRTGNGIRGITVTVPNTVAAMCRGTLYVAAFKGGKHQRPTHDTQLYRVPLPNLTSDYTFCLGNCRIPKEAKTEHISVWDQFIWESANTHNGRDPLNGIRKTSELADLLASYEGTGKFPRQKLIPTDHTFGEWLQQLSRKG